MPHRHQRRFFGESDQYRQARDKLLKAEIELKRQSEAVTQMRRELPLGGELKTDYRFTTVGESSQHQNLSALFEGKKDTLVIYSFMYGSAESSPCPMCTAFLDSLDGNAVHLQQTINLAVVAKAPAGVIKEFADSRNWNALSLLSSEGTTYRFNVAVVECVGSYSTRAW
jgi:predicted dithiol-disulfide oxidoreductase (DUF899 family)